MEEGERRGRVWVLVEGEDRVVKVVEGGKKRGRGEV